MRLVLVGDDRRLAAARGIDPGGGPIGLIRPGEGLSDTLRAELMSGAAERAAAITAAPRRSGIDLIVPDNVFGALAGAVSWKAKP